MLHGLCVGEEAGARNLVFFRVKWLQPAMKATSSVRRLRLGSFCARIVPPMCFATSGCVCVRRSMRFLNLWLQIALELLHDVAWAVCWGGSRRTKPCVFRVKWLQPAMKATSSVRRLRLGSFCARIVPRMCFATSTSGCVCVRSSMRFLNLWLQIALELLHDVEEAGARNLVFFRVKWLQPAMKATSSVRRLRLGSFCARIVPPMCFATSGCVCVRSSMRFLNLWLQIALELLHDVAWAVCWGGSRSTKPCVFRVKWLQPAMKATSSVRRLRLGSFCARIVPRMCFATSGCVCVRSSMRFLNLWLQIALELLHDVAWAVCWGGSRRTKPCVFPCKVAAAGDESYLVGAAVAAGVVLCANCSCVLQRVVVSVCVVLCGS